MAKKDSFITNPEFSSKTRENVFRGLVIFLALVFIFRLSYLQLIKGSIYRMESEAQAIKQELVEPFRGNMYDRNGLLMVHNEPSFTVRITPSDFRKSRIPLLSSILGVDTSEIDKILDRNQKYSRFEQIRVARDADFKTVSLIEENADFLPGVDISVESKRLYDFKGNMAHFLGYTREINAKQMEEKRFYKPGDVIGQSGLESSYEEFLRGTKGINFVAVNRNGKKISSFDRGKSDVPVSNGFDLYLGIDKRMQEKAEELLEGKRGTVVAIDPNNGEVMVMASKPDYDPRSFSGKIPTELYEKLRDDPGNPLFNRSIQSQYPPGSTFKMMVAVAALNEGVINENTTFYCNGSFTYGDRSYKCHGAHGQMSVRKAIQASCNSFFYQVALKLGLEKFGYYGTMFGFGQQSHIDIPNEFKGTMPTIQYLEKRYGKGKYPKGSIVNFGIGQGEVAVTPLQMAVYASILANKGTIYQPHIVRAINNNLTKKLEKLDYGSKKMPIDERVFDIVREGMFGVVNVPGGTANNAKIPGIIVCGKTGTAQNPHGQDHSWFICFAPMDHPKIAMCVMVENAGFGATVAAPIARDIMSVFFHPDSTSKQNPFNIPKKDSINKIITLNR